MISGVALLLVSGTAGLAEPFERLAATRWVWERADQIDCTDWQSFEVDLSARRIDVTFSEPRRSRGTLRDRVTYDILGAGPDHIDMFLTIETWRDAAGSLVWWRLELREDGSFVWIRSDWAPGYIAGPVYPCRPVG